MKKSPLSTLFMRAPVLKSAIGLAAALFISAANSLAADKTYDLNIDPTLNPEFDFTGSAAWSATGGVGDSGFIKLTDATGQSCAVLFPDFEPGFVVASFTFECMIKCGDWYANSPADGFSINFANASDPIIPLIAGGTNPGRGGRTDGWAGSQDNGGGEDNLPEEGTQSGIAIGFDTWGTGTAPVGGANGASDVRGISVRVGGRQLTQVAMPDVIFGDGQAHDYEHDSTTLITGPFTCGADPANPNFGDPACGPPALGTALKWVPLKVTVAQNGTLNVFWKGVNIVKDLSTPYGPSPGRIILGASTGGAMEFSGVDNIHIVTAASLEAIWGSPAVIADATGFTITISDSGPSQVNVTAANTTLTLDGNPITTWTSAKDNTTGTTTITYVLPGGALFASGSTHTVVGATVDGQTPAHPILSGTKSFTVFNYATIGASFVVTGVDKTKPGFVVKSWQSYHGYNNNNSHTERIVFGEAGRNMADLSAANPDGSFNEEATINYDSAPNGPGSNGHFPDAAMPGFPSTILPAGRIDNNALEVTTFIEFPTTGFWSLYVNSDDGFRVYAGRNLKDRFQIDNLQLGEFNGGRGAADTIFKFNVGQAGIYPIRLTWENGTGGQNVEFGSVASDGTFHLINDLSDPLALKAYRSGPTTKRAYIASIRPGVRNAPGVSSGEVIGEAGDPLVVKIADAETHASGFNLKVSVNGSPQKDITGTSTIVSAAGVTTITWLPPGGLAFNTDYDFVLSYNEDTSPVTTRSQSWNTRFYGLVMPSDLAANSFSIEAEDFDFQSGKAMDGAGGVNDPAYPGGAYQDIDAVLGVDYNNDDGGDSFPYRHHADGTRLDPNVNHDNVTGGRWSVQRPGKEMTSNWKIGWVGGGNWGSYTRVIPAGIYTAYSAQSFDDHGFGQLNGSLGLVTAGAGTVNQTVQTLGSFDSRGSGGWGLNDVMPLTSPVGKHAYFKLPGGKVTLRHTHNSGDFDWFTLTPVTGIAPQIVSATPAGGALVFENTPITIKIQDFSTTLNPASVVLVVNGTDVSTGVVKIKVGDTTTLTYAPSPVLAAGPASYAITFADTAGKSDSAVVNFTAYGVNLTGLFLVEGEDFNYDSGKTLAPASTMPYYGGAYNSANGLARAVLNVDYFDNDDNSSVVYRLGLNAQTPAQNVNITGNLGGRLGQTRGTWEMTSNWRIGWIGGGTWYNYTRTFPAADYLVYAALSFDGTSAGQLHGRLQVVDTDPTQPGQTVHDVGTFDAPGTASVGGWGANELVQMKDANGNPATVHLSGVQTVRYAPDSGDFDYLAFVPTVSAPRFTSIVNNGNGTVTVNWIGAGELQVADKLTGPWANTGVTTGTITAPIDRISRFARIRSP